MSAIRELRHDHGMTQAELADRAGLSEYAVQRYEYGQRTPTLDSIVKLSEAFDMSPGELVEYLVNDDGRNFGSEEFQTALEDVFGFVSPVRMTETDDGTEVWAVDVSDTYSDDRVQVAYDFEESKLLCSDRSQRMNVVAEVDTINGLKDEAENLLNDIRDME